MSENHVDIFLDSRDEIIIDEVEGRSTIRLGGTAKIFLLSSSFNLDNFIDKLNNVYEQAKAREEANCEGTDPGGAKEPGSYPSHRALKA